MKKRLSAILLALCMVLALLPGTALAEDPASELDSGSSGLPKVAVIPATGKAQEFFTFADAVVYNDTFRSNDIATTIQMLDDCSENICFA